MNRTAVFACLLLSLTFLLPAQLSAQGKPKPADFGIKSKKAMKAYLEGLQYAQYRDRDGAIAAFEEAISLEPDFARAHYQLGINAYVQKDYEAAIPHLEKAQAGDDGNFRAIGFYLGETYFHLGRYAESVPALEAFVARGEGRRQDMEQATYTLRHARFAAQAIADSVSFTPINLGTAINSPHDEYLPYLIADDTYLLFTSRRPQSVGGFNPRLQRYNEDFFYSQWDGEAWSAAENLGPPINTRENEGAAAITQDGRTIFFTSCNREDGIGGCDIYYSVREGSRWRRPVNLGPAVNTVAWEGHPCLSGDGRTLYFASSRPGGEGGSDIWYTRLVGGAWAEAQPLGTPVNTPGNEDSPFLHADDQSLYFSSDYHPGFGGQDIFLSFRNEDGSWSEPQNLGYPLNTVAHESHLFVNAQGREGFMNSDREGGLGGSDIYRFEMAPRNRPRIATFLRGRVQDSLTSKPVAAHLRLVDVETGDTIREVDTDPNKGNFLMTLPLEREYAAFVEAEGYLFTTRNFYLKDLPEETYFDLVIELAPLKKDVQVVLQNIFFAFGSDSLEATSHPELAFLVSFMEKNPNIRIEIQGHTDDVGSEADNLDLSQRRAESVRAYLIAAGISGERIVAQGYGESMPVAGNITDEDRARNRRTEFKILDTGE